MEWQTGEHRKGSAWPAVIARTAWFIVLWFALSGFHLADAPAAVLAVAAATWASLRLSATRKRPAISHSTGCTRASAFSAVNFRWRGRRVARTRSKASIASWLCDLQGATASGPARSAFLTLMSLLRDLCRLGKTAAQSPFTVWMSASQWRRKWPKKRNFFIQALGADPNND